MPRKNSVKNFTDAQKINFFILCAKATGLNDKLMDDGSLGREAIAAARAYLHEASRHPVHRADQLKKPDLTLIESALALLVPEDEFPRRSIRTFFAQHSINDL